MFVVCFLHGRVGWEGGEFGVLLLATQISGFGFRMLLLFDKTLLAVVVGPCGRRQFWKITISSCLTCWREKSYPTTRLEWWCDAVDRSVGRSLRPIVRSIDRLIGRSLDRSAARSVAASFASSVDRSLDRSLRRSLGRSDARSLDHSITMSCGGSNLELETCCGII